MRLKSVTADSKKLSKQERVNTDPILLCNYMRGIFPVFIPVFELYVTE